jgi:hypothetical protein
MKVVTGPTMKLWFSSFCLTILAGCGQAVTDSADASTAPYSQSSVFGEVEGYYGQYSAELHSIPASSLAHVDAPAWTPGLGEFHGSEEVGNMERNLADDPLWTTEYASSASGKSVATFINSGEEVPGSESAVSAPAPCPVSWCDDGDLSTRDLCNTNEQTPDGFLCSTEYDPTSEGAPCRQGRHCCPDGRIHQQCPDTGGRCPDWWCNDGDSCTEDQCIGSGESRTCLHKARGCDDGNSCTADSCQPLLGCRHTPQARSIACYTGPDLTEGIGICGSGVRLCHTGASKACRGQVLPEVESCNGVDDDCDGETDEQDAIGCRIFYRDEDADTYGQDGDTRCLCLQGSLYRASRAGDCNDGLRSIRPGAREACGDDVDTNCNGQVDEGCPARL